MNDKQKKLYISWLNDAHAMEAGLVTMLEKQVAETEDEPMMQDRIKEHLDDTRRHLELVDACIVRNGGDPSAGKDFFSKLSAAVGGMGMSLSSDARIKMVLNSYAAEHMEIASYTALKAAAEAVGDTETVNICDEILEEEIEMADWLLEQLPIATSTFVEETDE